MADDSQRIKYVYADSTNRDTGLYPSGNSYVLHLTSPIHSVIQVDLVAAKVPNTMYNITDGSNVLVVSSNNISIATGFYSACGLASAISNSTGLFLDVVYLSDEGRFLFTSNSAFTIQGTTTEIRKVLGLNTGTASSFAGSTSPIYVNDPTYGSYNLYKSPRLIDLSLNEYVFLDIEELRTTSVLDAKKLVNGTTEGTSIRSTFGMVPMDVNSGDIKNYKETTDYSQYLVYDSPIPKIQRLTVRWINSRGQALDFQGFDNNAFTLRFHCEYREPLPPPQPLKDVEIQRIVDAMTHAPPPPKPPEEKRTFGRWVVLLIVIGVIASYMAYVRLLKPLIERMNAIPPPEPFKPKVSLY